MRTSPPHPLAVSPTPAASFPTVNPHTKLGRQSCDGAAAPEPLIEIQNGSIALAEHREAASMDQDVSIGHVNFPVKLMSIRDTDDGWLAHRTYRMP
jgi:hypothetical protein